MKKKFFIFGLPLLLFFVFAFLLRLLIVSGNIEKQCLIYLEKRLSKEGIIFKFKEASGNVKSGVILKDFILKGDGYHFEAKRVFLRTRRTPLLFGTFIVKEFRVEGLKGFINNKKEKRDRKFEIPLWLSCFAKNISISVNHLEIEGEKRVVFEDCRIDSNLKIVLKEVYLHNLRIKNVKNSYGKYIDFNGFINFSPSKNFVLLGDLTFGQSGGKIKITFKEKDKFNDLTIQIENFFTDLKDFGFIYNFPDLKMVLNISLNFSKDSFELKGNFDQKDYGKFDVNIKGKIDKESVFGRVKVVSKPLYYSLGVKEIKDDKLTLNSSLEGNFTYSLSKKSLKTKLVGNFMKSKILGMDLESGSSSIETDGEDLNIFSSFSSPEAGKGDIEIDYNFSTAKTKVKFRTKSINPSNVLEKLGIDLTLPYPLKFSKSNFDIPLAELIFYGQETEITISAVDGKLKPYYVDINFQDLNLTKLTIDVDKIDPSLWGIKKDLLFSGKLLFDFTNQSTIPFDLQNSYFYFDDFVIGPINTNLKIVNATKLIIPKTTLPSQFGNISLEGYIDENGDFNGSMVLDKFEIKKEFSAIFSGNFKLFGNFSKLNLKGNLTSKMVEGNSFVISKPIINGSVIVDENDYYFDVEATSSYSNFFGKELNNISIKAKKAEHFSLFEASFNFLKMSIETKGSFDISNKEVLLSFCKILLNEKNLYLKDKTRISFKDKILLFDNFSLVSGSSSIYLNGGIDFENEGLDAKVLIHNFPLALIPLKGYLYYLKGRIDADFYLKGNFQNPNMNGEITVRNITLPLQDSDLKITGIVGVNLVGDTLEFKNVYLTTNEEGDLYLKGYIKLKNFLPYDYNISIEGSDFPIIYKKLLSIFTDIDIKLSGNDEKINVDGNVLILKGRVQLKESFTADLPETIIFKGKKEVERKEDFFKSLLRKARGSIKISAKKKFWAIRKDLLAQLKGDIYLNFTKNGLSPQGKLYIDEGRLFISSSKFDLKDSSFYLSGGESLEPYIDIIGTREINDYTINVRLYGMASKPTLSLTSIPPLEEGDILSLIIFGRTSQELNPEESAKWGGFAASLALNYEASSIFKSVSKNAKIDTILVSSSKSGDPQLTFSKYLNDKLVVEFEQTFGSLNESEISLRYRFNKRLSIETNSSTLKGSGADITWEQRY